MHACRRNGILLGGEATQLYGAADEIGQTVENPAIIRSTLHLRMNYTYTLILATDGINAGTSAAGANGNNFHANEYEFLGY